MPHYVRLGKVPHKRHTQFRRPDGELWLSLGARPILNLTDWAAGELGVRSGTPVVGGSGDQPAGAVGNGIVREGIVSATMGTSGVVFAHSAQPVRDAEGRVHSMCSAVEGEWCVFGCMLSAAGSFLWFKRKGWL